MGGLALPNRPGAEIVKKITFKKGLTFGRNERIIISVKGMRAGTPPRRECIALTRSSTDNIGKKFLENVEKPLDNATKMWYNVNVSKREVVKPLVNKFG